MDNKEFWENYNGRYSCYWKFRFGMIPALPASFDNARDIYQLVAWLQRAFKMLLDDFLNLEIEFEEFKNALIELLQNLIPQIIREFVHSEEFKEIIFDLVDEWYEINLKPTIEQILNRLDKIEQDITEIRQEISNIKQDITNINNKIENIEGDITNIENKLDSNNEALEKILNHLESIGVWQGGINGDFQSGKGIAGGSINIFGGTLDGDYYIRTSSQNKENDLAGGV